MKRKKKDIQKKLLDKYSKYGFNENGELNKLDAQLIDYLKQDLEQKNQDKQNRIDTLEKERIESNRPINFNEDFITDNFNVDPEQ